MTVSATFTEYLDARRAEVETALAAVLPDPPDAPGVVNSAMRYSLLAGGKRVRPILCLASAEAVGGERRLAMPAACAIELIHTYSLVHDDLPAMDNDTTRRGRPTLHVVAGEGMAILAGDGLLTEAFHLLAREPLASDPIMAVRKLRAIETIAHAAGATGMVGGQALDLVSSNAEARRDGAVLDAEALRSMHTRKTGALIRASAAAGAIMGGGTPHQIAAIDQAAAEFGLAFQIVDDILDVDGAPDKMGKAVGKDAAAGKTTYPALYGVERSREMAAECLERAEAALRTSAIEYRVLMGIGQWIVRRVS